MHTPDDRDAGLFTRAFSALLEDAPEAPEFENLLFTVDVPAVGPSAGSGRRSPWVVAVSVAAVLVLVGLLPALIQGVDEGLDAVGSVPGPSLGVFEPLRGRIVVINGGELVGIDPADVSSPVTLDIPDLPPVPDEACPWSGPCDDGAISLTPVGWSDDGTVLALESEYAGMSYLMNEDGTLTRIPWERIDDVGGCCAFAGSNWLAPDGVHAPMSRGLGVAVVDVRDMSIESEASLDPDEFPGVEGWGQIYYQTWSPDGTEIAFSVERNEDGAQTPTIQVYNRSSNTVRQLPDHGFGHIRNLAWSPDGSHLLVIAGDLVLRYDEMTNPLTRPVATSIYLIDIKSGASRVIADGHYVAAAWSPDGSQIAAIDYPSGHYLVVMNADGTNQNRLADMNGYGYDNLFTGVSWHPVP